MLDVVFDKESHTYRDQKGRAYPSVTTVIKDAGFIDLSMIKPDVLEAKRDLGSRVHEACALYDEGNLAECPADCQPYLNGWIKFREENPLVFTAIELPLIHVGSGFAGTPDRVGYWLKRSRGAYFVLDIKTCQSDPSHGVQTAAYAILVKDSLGNIIRDRVCVVLGKDSYRIHEHKSQMDAVYFRSALNCWKFRTAER